MKPEEQRIEIAIACGWKKNPLNSGYYPPNLNPIINLNQEFKLPDYLNDLNDMHEAEKVLTMDQCRDFDDLLWTNSESCASIEFKWHAPPEARAEAFLKAIGKWKDCE